MRNGSDFNPQTLPTFVRALQDSGATELTLRRGQTLFAQGARADALFYIRHGKVKITVLSEHGKEGVIGILKAGDFCGESCLAGETVRLASAEAMTDCVALRIEKLSLPLYGTLRRRRSTSVAWSTAWSSIPGLACIRMLISSAEG